MLFGNVVIRKKGYSRSCPFGKNGFRDSGFGKMGVGKIDSGKWILYTYYAYIHRIVYIAALGEKNGFEFFGENYGFSDYLRRKKK